MTYRDMLWRTVFSFICFVCSCTRVQVLDHTRKALQKLEEIRRKFSDGQMPQLYFVISTRPQTPLLATECMKSTGAMYEVRKTRGLEAMTLKSSSYWWHGPSWLSELRIPDQPKLTKTGSERKKLQFSIPPNWSNLLWTH